MSETVSQTLMHCFSSIAWLLFAQFMHASLSVLRRVQHDRMEEQHPLTPLSMPTAELQTCQASTHRSR